MKTLKHLSGISLLFLLLILFLSTSCRKQTHYSNPVIRGDMADPSLIKIDDTYYVTATSSEWAPFYPLFSSKDLINWKQEGHIFDEQPEWTSSSFWAPELFYHNNKVFCYYTARRKSDGVSCIGVATADSPTGKFTDHGVIIECGREAIDAFIYDDNGQLYITWKAYGLDYRPIEILGSKLSSDGLRLEGETFSLLIDDENIGMEGQYHFSKDGYFYIVYATHGCCGPGSDYQTAVARARNFKGPYEKYEGNPILSGGGDFMSCGHGTAVELPDERMYYLCHAYLKDEGFYGGRQHVLFEMKIDEDNWVYFPGGVEAMKEQPMPFKGIKQNPVSDMTDEFKENKLCNEWTWNYVYSDIQYNIQDGKLSLNGMPKEGNRYGTVLCIRPVSTDYSYETKVEGKNFSNKGLTMYGDNDNLLFLTWADNKLMSKLVKDGYETTLYDIVCPAVEEIYLKIEVRSGRYCTFLWSLDGKEWQKIDEEFLDAGGLVRWDRVARPGLIHIGNGAEPAVFSYFKYTNEVGN